MIYTKRDNFNLDGNKRWTHDMRKTLVGTWFINNTGHKILILAMPKYNQATDNIIPVYVAGEGVRLTSWFSILHLEVITSKGTSAGAMWIDATKYQSIIDGFEDTFKEKVENKEPVIQQNPVAEIVKNYEYDELYQSVIEAGLKVFKIEGKVIVAANEWKARRQYRKMIGKISCTEV